MPIKTLAERVIEFGNKLAFQLKPSNDTMEAVRLARQELTSLLTDLQTEKEEAVKQAVEETQARLGSFLKHDLQCAVEFEVGDCDCGLVKLLTQKQISLCTTCNSMTKTIEGVCGKCEANKQNV